MKKVLFFLGLLILQIVIVGLIIVLAFSAFFIVDVLLVLLLMVLVIFAILIVSAIWTRRDVKKFISQGVDAWMPAGWVLVMLFFWFPGLTIYLYLRKFSYKMEFQGRSQTT